MKQLLITITAVVLVGCATTQKPEPPIAKAPDILIQEAAFNGDIAAIKQHIAAGTDVNAANEWGTTPLQIAASMGHRHNHKKIVELLIAEGADVNAKVVGDANKGMTPLDLAIDSDNPNASARMADLLRKHGGKTGEELKAAEN